MRTSNLPGKLYAALMMLFCIALVAASPAAAQKKGGTLRLYHNDNPPSTSLHEEATIASVTPFAAIFNNLVVFDPAKVHESIETVIPDLAESWASCHLTPCRSLNVNLVLVGSHAQLSARSGMTVSMLSWTLAGSNVTRLLKTAAKGITEAMVDSS